MITLSNQLGFLLAAAAVFFISGANTPAYCATYYVAKTGKDSNACTQTAPCLSIARGSSVATQPGDIVQVAAGSYSESLTLSHAGSSGKNIILRGQDGSGCPTTTVSDANNPTGTRPASAVTISGSWYIAANYITIDCFHFLSTGNGLVSVNASTTGGTITNNELDGNGSSSPGTGLAFSGIASVNSASYASNYTVQRNYIHGTSTGIFLVCNSCMISENEIKSLAGNEPGSDHDYIDAWGISTVIRHNYMWDNTSNACNSYDCHMDCIQTWNTTGNGTEVAKNFTVDRNVCFNSMEGIIVQDNAGNGDVSNWIVTNNVFAYGPWDDGSGHLAVAGTAHPWCWVFQDGKLGTGLFENNTCISGAAGFQSATGTAVYTNNIFYNASGGTTVYQNSGTPSISGANNLYYSPGGTWKGTFAGDIVNKNPSFVSLGTGSGQQQCIGCNYSVQSASPAIDAGLNTSPTVTVDIKGAARPQGAAYDIGAYEFASGQSLMPPTSVRATVR